MCRQRNVISEICLPLLLVTNRLITAQTWFFTVVRVGSSFSETLCAIGLLKNIMCLTTTARRSPQYRTPTIRDNTFSCPTDVLEVSRTSNAPLIPRSPPLPSSSILPKTQTISSTPLTKKLYSHASRRSTPRSCSPSAFVRDS
ncbi:hypothetical protein IWX91DRAFT_171489 [Phyllosticta citricarpa]